MADPATAAALRAPAVAPGETIALAGRNDEAWFTAYRELIEADAVVLLLDHDAPGSEHARRLEEAGGGRLAIVGDGGQVELRGEPVTGAYPPGTVLLPSSGSTGAPKLVARSVASLRAEGRRHARWSGLSPEDHVVLPLPMWHAYALGWVHAVLLTGCALTPVPPTGLTRCAELIARDATVLPLVPVVARLLAARRRAAGPENRLRLAMVGAGPVDDELDHAFRAAFGIGLARNYGSTETGALFSAEAGAPSRWVGHPLDGVELRVLDEDGTEVPAGTAGELHVRLDGGPWRAMGDLVVTGESGVLPLGRRTRAVRRGDRWIAPEEIEAVLRAHPDVADVRVYAGSARPEGTTLHADVVHVRGPGAGHAGIREHAKAALAPHKVPDRWHLVGDVPRSPVGKPLPPRPLGLSGPDVLTAAATAYKQGELLFTLLDLGIVDRLAEGAATPAEVAGALGIDHDVCAELMRTAEEAGILGPAPDPAAVEALPVLRLEQELSRAWVTREELSALGRGGLGGRRFDRAGPGDELREIYLEAMHDAGARRRAGLGLKLAGHRTGGSLLEITCGPGRYVDSAGAGTVATVGALAPAGRPIPDGGFDLVVLANAIHLPGASDLRRLATLLAPGGTVLIDDVFLGVPGGLPAETRLDWLTHGGLAWPTESSLALGLTTAGLTVERTVHTGRPQCTLMVARAPGRPS
ncbi:hypothetical protein SD37_16785 [Amycolatopsis orientalis]|uniref:AMP-dependent synthetase/ligase domain-containing protein n=1 Tax=Amycolatopsis orientalis TaxID=31958 RepID=A0A193BY87_AMYOR|nr:AMP-binding protein [Amycolatopsis orientalis]ANN17135.1 hypothetical protein SD37_16785 [Amycolatopsis orientalis]